MKIISFENLQRANLILDAVYEGGRRGNAGDDPISKLIPGVGNMGGFRYAGRGERKKIVVLYTSGEDRDWPDTFDLRTGRFHYYGDNRTSGHELHDTKRGGNRFLRTIFERLHSNGEDWKTVPPILVFEKYPTEASRRSVRFRGLLVPSAEGLSSTEDLVAIWRIKNGSRFQNYRATFTVLDCSVIERSWLESLLTGEENETLAPPAWKEWIGSKKYVPLKAEPTISIRSVEEQLPSEPNDKEILNAIYEHFRENPRAFEYFAADLYAMSDTRVIVDEVTRASIDGGRDAIGRYKLGLDDDPVYVEFTLEAKCYRPATYDDHPSTVGVKEVARLISRLLHRQYGVMVTTSVVARQAYEEVRNDGHPVVFIAGKDIVDILVRNGCSNREQVEDLLKRKYPSNDGER